MTLLAIESASVEICSQLSGYCSQTIYVGLAKHFPIKPREMATQLSHHSAHLNIIEPPAHRTRVIHSR
jgi:hypothetical protein